MGGRYDAGAVGLFGPSLCLRGGVLRVGGVWPAGRACLGPIYGLKVLWWGALGAGVVVQGGSGWVLCSAGRGAFWGLGSGTRGVGACGLGALGGGSVPGGLSGLLFVWRRFCAFDPGRGSGGLPGPRVSLCGCSFLCSCSVQAWALGAACLV